MTKYKWAPVIAAVAAFIVAITPGMVAFLEGAGEKADSSYEILAKELNETRDDVNELRVLVHMLLENSMGPVTMAEPEEEFEEEGAEESVNEPAPPVRRKPMAPPVMRAAAQRQLPETLGEAMEER